MKVINRQNQHEIGFDIGCLPAWGKFLYKDNWFLNIWFFSDVRPEFDVQSESVLHKGFYGAIPKDYQPKRLDDDDNYLFLIDRSEMVKYNGTAI